MKLFRFTLVLLFSVCLIISVNGQKRTNKPLKKGNACQSNSISFSCPKGFQIKSGQSNKIFAAYDSKTEVGLYALNPTGALSEQDLIDETLKNALQSLYLTDYKDYEWKDSPDYTGDYKWSQYETAKFARVGFNKSKQQTIHVQFVRLAFNQKEILAGFVYELATGKSAEEMFKTWSGGGNGDASDALQDLVIKITGEKKTDDTPGGPPPVKSN
jgi:hypothetical protein